VVLIRIWQIFGSGFQQILFAKIPQHLVRNAWRIVSKPGSLYHTKPDLNGVTKLKPRSKDFQQNFEEFYEKS